MKKEQILKFLAAVGVKNPQVGDQWVSGSCPLAPWTHPKKTDNRISFAVNLESGNFNCFTCMNGSLTKLLQTLEMYVADTPGVEAKYHFALAREALEGSAGDFEPLPLYEEESKEKAFEEWPGWWLDSFTPWRNSPRAAWYLLEGRTKMGKGEPIAPEIADTLRLCYDGLHDRIVCPYWSFAGKLAGARGRSIDLEAQFPHYDYTWNKVNNAHLVWYHETCLEGAAEARAPVIVVEGQFDCANVMRSYPYVVAGLTAKSSLKKLRKLAVCDAVVVMLDNDATGDKAWARYQEHLGGKVKLGRLSFPKEYKDPAFLPKEVMDSLFKPLLDV